MYNIKVKQDATNKFYILRESELNGEHKKKRASNLYQLLEKEEFKFVHVWIEGKNIYIKQSRNKRGKEVDAIYEIKRTEEK